MKVSYFVIEQKPDQTFVHREVEGGDIVLLPFILRVKDNITDKRKQVRKKLYIQGIDDKGIALTESLDKAKIFGNPAWSGKEISEHLKRLRIVLNNLGYAEWEIEVLFLLTTVTTRIATVIGNHKNHFADAKNTWLVLNKEAVTLDTLPGLIGKTMSTKNRLPHIQIWFDDTPYFLNLIKRRHIKTDHLISASVRTGFNLDQDEQYLHAVWHAAAGKRLLLNDSLKSWGFCSAETVSNILKETVFSKIPDFLKTRF